jgi:hypothetical protein
MNKNVIGIDRCKFELTFRTSQYSINQIIPIINERNYQYGEIVMERGKMMISLCLPKYFDIHNAVPVKLEKHLYFDDICKIIVATIKVNFSGPFRTTLTSIEMNITEVFENCDCDKMLLLLSHSLLDKVKQNARYEIKSDIIKPMTSGIKTRLIKGKWFLKAYDKQKQIESEYGIIIDNSPIRIEFVFSKLALEKLFGSKRKLQSILSRTGLTILLNAYKDTLEELINEYVNPYLDNVHNLLMTHIRKTNSIHETYCEFKEVIYDKEQLRRVLKDWNKERGMQDNSRITLSKLNNKYLLPKGVFKTISNLSTLFKKY